jgi:hypothetical protein
MSGDATREAARLGREERILSHLRLAVFVLAAGAAWLAFGSRSLAPGWLAPPVAAFAVLVWWHDRTIRRRRRADRRAGFYADGLARIEDRWAGRGPSGDAYRDAQHPYADDLDCFGEGSLFDLLCTARTPLGERTLATWLLAPAPVEVARARQEAVEELRPRLDLREDLALLGEDVRGHFAPPALLRWAEAPVTLASRGLARAGAALAAATALGLALWLATGAGPLPFLAALLAQGALAAALRSRVATAIRAAEEPTRELALLSQLLERLEREPFASPLLASLRRSLETEGLPPGRQIARLRRRAELLDARRNQFFAPIAALLLWGTQLAIAIERWRATCGPRLRAWLETAGEIEALCALAAYAYEHPGDPFPELVEDGPIFEGAALGHPLLPAARCVRNDLRLAAEPQALVVSGSNMSGKSTLLRTVGVNAILAFAGAPVRAQRLRLSPLAVAASIRLSDSLQKGTSRFYAEIQRLHQIVELAGGERPALFLLDEILHGTNSHDRRIGAEALVRGLLARGALGLVTTHDLALAEVADALAPRVGNVHFEDHLEDGEMRFDYRLRPGVVRKSNALALMRAVGLQV